MKQWLSETFLSVKHGATYFRAFFNPLIGLMYIALFVQWLITPYVHVWHLLFTFVVVGIIDGKSFRQGLYCERDWSIKHPKQ